MQLLGLPFWELAHCFCILASALLAVLGCVGFVLTGMVLNFNDESLVILAWATFAVGAISTAIDRTILGLLYRLNEPDQTQSFNMKHTRKKLTILGSSTVNLGLAAVLAIGISAADDIAVGVRHNSVHPGGTRFMAIICIFAKALTIAIDVHLLIGESKRHRRFEMLLQEGQDPVYQDEPLAPLTGTPTDISGDNRVEQGSQIV